MKTRLWLSQVWALWTNKNDVRHGGLRNNGQKLFQWCSFCLEEFWVATVVPPKPIPLEPPTAPTYKVNVNGAVFSSQKEAGVGVIIRDHVGNFIAGLSEKLQAPLGAIEVETKAFEYGLLFSRTSTSP